MRILVNLITLHDQSGFVLAQAWRHGLSLFAQARPDIQWYAIVRPGTTLQQDIQVISYRAPLRNSIQRGIWLRISLPRIIRSIKPDVVWHADASFAIGTRVPQWATIDALPVTAFPEAPLAGRRESVRLAWKHIRSRAAGCFTTQPAVSEFAERNIPEKPNWMQLLPPLVGATSTVAHPASELDHLYFLTTPMHPSDPLIVDTLKAFSKFKKRLQSGMYLVIHTGPFPPDAALQQKLATYKYREHVVLVHSLSPEAESGLYADAYALVHPGGYLASAFPLLRAVRAEVPVLTPYQDAAMILPEEAILRFEPGIDSLAQSMMWIYKEENDRAQRIHEANKWLAAYPPEAVAKAFVNFLTAHLPTH